MKKIEVEIGDGITSRTRQRRSLDPGKPHDAAEIAAEFEQMATIALQEWGAQRAIIEAVRREAACLRAEDTCRAANDVTYIGGEEYNVRYKERATIPWYVREMDANATMTELAMAGGRPWEAVSWAMKLAEAHAEARLRHGWNKSATVGAKQLGHAADGRAACRLQPAEERVARVDELVREGQSKRSAMAQTAGELNVSYQAIRRDYYSKKRSKPVD